MEKLYCDLCGKEITQEKDHHRLMVVRAVDDKPSLKSMDLCPHCKEELGEWIGGKHE